jgi:hypothetical protein
MIGQRNFRLASSQFLSSGLWIFGVVIFSDRNNEKRVERMTDG